MGVSDGRSLNHENTTLSITPTPIPEVATHVDGVVVHFFALCVILGRHQPRLEKILIKTVTQCSNGYVLCAGKNREEGR